MFERGQRVRCVNDRGWVDYVTRAETTGPEFGEVCTVSQIKLQSLAPLPDRQFLFFSRYGLRGYDSRVFRPLEDREMEKLAALVAEPPLKVRELAEALA